MGPFSGTVEEATLSDRESELQSVCLSLSSVNNLFFIFERRWINSGFTSGWFLRFNRTGSLGELFLKHLVECVLEVFPQTDE